MPPLTKERKTELLTQFNENAELKQAVSEELLDGIYDQGVSIEGKERNPTRNWALSLAINEEFSEMTNEQRGARLVAVGEGIRFLEVAMKRISENYKEPTKPAAQAKNAAR